ncbi:hypothetical protein [Streptomyces sp. DH12]|uniref:hypothetical protein n=1 Tax=Streptomyces sp. DH12 TaxID=2857010 RepID=UPI001E3FEBFF|nr:hypothetical protein [Streptomyces sp. DH12]
MSARTIVLDGDTTPLVITDRPSGEDYDPLPDGTTPERIRVVRARQAKAGDLLLGDFADDLGNPRQLLHWEEIVTAAPAPMTVPCWAACCWERPECDVTRYIRLAPAVDDDTPCEIFAINAPVLIVQAPQPSNEGGTA